MSQLQLNHKLSVDEACRESADRLYDFICREHLQDDGSLIGPDSGVRWNLRIGRFVKSYLPFVQWSDQSQYHMQTQGYWIFSNLDYYTVTKDERYKEAALKCADVVVKRQTEGGYWEYDNPDWAGRVTTVEGSFAVLGLLSAYRASGNAAYLESCVRFYDFLMNVTGFREYDSESLSLNYFATHGCPMVPNNSTLGLWLFSELADVTGENRFLDHTQEMINFISRVQSESGELPYSLTTEHKRGKPHYLCFQYHAFQFIDLAEYYRYTHNEQITPVLRKIAGFLRSGLSSRGDAMFDCRKKRPIVPYYTAAVAAALMTADKMGFDDNEAMVDAAYRRLVSQQRSDGGFDYSRNNYGLLCDRRSYPRMQAMLLRHLLVRAFSGELS